MEQTQTNVNNLPRISFTTTQIKVATVYEGVANYNNSSGTLNETRTAIAAVAKYIPSDITWSEALLVVKDSIYNGYSRHVLVEFGQDSNKYTFIKSVEPLFKMEFEELFGFTSGEFVKGRIIRILSESINVD